MHQAINTRMGPAEWSILGVLALLWGGSFFLGELALEGLPPFTIVFARTAVAGLVLLGLLRLRGLTMPRGWAAWRPLLVMAVVNSALPFSLIVWGQTHIDGGLASVLNATAPLFTVLLARRMTRDEGGGPGKLVGVITGLLGVAVMMGMGALSGARAELLAQAAPVGAALCYAWSGLYARRLAATPPLVLATGQVGLTALLMLPLCLLVDRPWSLPTPGAASIAAVLGMALLCTALAYLLYFRLLARAGATNVILVTYLIPVSAIALGAIFLGERLAPHQLAGVALIALGLAFVDGRLWGFARRRADKA
jgi:drug/metabolite transporter (DMT)-like permease